MDLLALRAEAKEVELAYLVHAEVPQIVVGDPGRFRQVLVNLAGNAIKFTERGEVVVRVSQAADGDSEVTLRVEVADTGIGVAGDVLQRLFEPFSQADTSTTRAYGGTGLGLSISKQLVEMMGGLIGADSEPGKGSTFWFAVPFAKPTDEARFRPAPRSELRGLRVLIVDDHATNRRILEHHVESWDMEPEAAADGATALRALAAAADAGRSFDLVLLDYQMPHMDGIELARRIRADSRFDAARLVMLTSLGRRGDAARAREVGIAGYLTKPVGSSLLFNTLATVVGREPTLTHAQIVTRHTCREADVLGEALVLLVEDNPVNQTVASRMLAKLGYRSDVAGNGREALAALDRVTYDLILMDCQMPVMDGFAATAAVREHPNGGDVPIVAMTANAMRGDRDRCLERGMDDYLPKPVKLRDLQAVLRRWLAPGQDGGDRAA